MHGKNELPEKVVSPWYVLMNLLLEPMPIMIWLAIVIEAVIAKWMDMTILLGIQIANASIAFYETTKAGNAVAALKASLKPEATVKRDGKWRTLDAALVVPGDVVLLATGSAVPADCRINEGNIEVDQAALTGESLPVSMFKVKGLGHLLQPLPSSSSTASPPPRCPLPPPPPPGRRLPDGQHGGARRGGGHRGIHGRQHLLRPHRLPPPGAAAAAARLASSAPPRSLPHPVCFSFLRDRRQNDSEPSNLQNMLMDIMIVLVRHHRSFCHRIRPPSSIPPSSPDHCLPRRAPSPARWWYL